MNDYITYFKSKFDIEEIVPKSIFEAVGQGAWNLFDPDLLSGGGWMRERFGPAYCNNWAIGGNNQWRGLRTPEAGKVYSRTSQHTLLADHLCSALDLTFSNYSAAEVREEIRDLKSIPFITRIEDNVNWIHIDVKPMNHDGVYFFKP